MIDPKKDFLDAITEGFIASMKTLVLLAAIVLLAILILGCATHTISIGPESINATSTALIYCPEATVIRVVDGNRTMDMLSEASGVGAVVQGLGDNAMEVMKQ